MKAAGLPLALVVLSMAGLSAQALHVDGGQFKDASGTVVVLRGVASMGMGMVYGDKGNPGTYLPMTPAQYIERTLQTDATGGVWWSNAIRLNFERFPSASPGRLYTKEFQPYALGDTTSFPAWAASTQYAEGDIRTDGGVRYIGAKYKWRADKSLTWNPAPYAVGDVVVSLLGEGMNRYRCLLVEEHLDVAFANNWGAYPKGFGTFVENQGKYVYTWQYIGAYGLSGTVPIGQIAPTPIVYAGATTNYWFDNAMAWTRLSDDYTQAQMDANFVEWTNKVLDPVVQRAVDLGLYVIICEFDFGPAHHPLRHTRLVDFWGRLAKSKWANHPQVLFELWNESESIGSYSGSAGSWAVQKPVIQEVVNLIRATANNIIIIPPPFYSAWVGEATASPIAGVNLAYAWHQYRSQWDAYQSNRDQARAGLASGQAIVMTEWGDDTSETDPTKMWPTSSLRALLEDPAHPAAGHFAWSLSNSWSPVLFSDAALRQPKPFGVAARQWLADLHGGTSTLGAPMNLRVQ